MKDMKDMPMLFTSTMVGALLDKRKTNTRRLNGLDRARWTYNGQIVNINEDPDRWALVEEYQLPPNEFSFYDKTCVMSAPCIVKTPYILGRKIWGREGLYRGPDGRWRYRYDDNLIIVPPKYYPDSVVWAGHKEQDYASSMFMPKWACRLWRELDEVRLERLQDITEEDAMAEGVEFDYGWQEECGEGYTDGCGFRDYSTEDDFTCETARDSFITLWDSINGKSYPWSLNPWVAVLKIREIEESLPEGGLGKSSNAGPIPLPLYGLGC